MSARAVARGALLALLGLTSACVSAGGGRFGSQRRALEAQRPGGFETDLATDVISTAGMFLAGVLVDREKGEWDRVPPCAGARRRPTLEDERRFAALAPHGGTCDASAVPGIDRPVTGFAWEAARPLSDVALLTMIALPYGVSAADTGFNDIPAASFGIDALIITQTLSANLLGTALLKVLVRRARPLTYNPLFDKRDRFDGDARLSFPSGHSSMAFAAASTTAIMLLKRYPGRAGAHLGVAGAYLGATTVAALRVAAGKHFFTDVLAGAALGTFIGLAIPLGHSTSGETAAASAGQNRGALPIFSVGGAF